MRRAERTLQQVLQQAYVLAEIRGGVMFWNVSLRTKQSFAPARASRSAQC